MALFGYNDVQEVALNQGAIFNTIIRCPRGYVLHDEESGILLIHGIVRNPCACYARFKIDAGCNIAIPEGGTVAPIATAITVNGEIRPLTRAIATPAAIGDYTNVYTSDIVDVPRDAWFAVSYRNVAASTTETPAPNINMT